MILKVMYWPDGQHSKPTTHLIECIEALYHEPVKVKTHKESLAIQIRRRLSDTIDTEFITIYAGTTVFFMENGKTIDTIHFH